MPTNRRYRTRQRRDDLAHLDAFGEFALTHGRDMLGGSGFGDGVDQLAEAWELHGERIAAEWVAEHPGSRPWGWWVFTHRKERPIVHPMPAEVEAAARRHHTRFGFLHAGIRHGHGAPPGELWPWQEDETAYLERRGLLTAAEKAALDLAF